MEQVEYTSRSSFGRVSACLNAFVCHHLANVASGMPTLQLMVQLVLHTSCVYKGLYQLVGTWD